MFTSEVAQPVAGSNLCNPQTTLRLSTFYRVQPTFYRGETMAAKTEALAAALRMSYDVSLSWK